MLDTYKFRNATEMKNAIEKIDSDGYYGQSKYSRITEKTDVTPNEVTDFYNEGAKANYPSFQYILSEDGKF